MFKSRWSFIGAAAAAAGALVFTPLTALAEVTPDIVTIDINAITDFHGHIENAAALSQTVKDNKAANPNTIFVANGDNVGGSAFVSSVAQDQPTIDILNAMGLEVSSVGNHEFDQGYDDLSGRIEPKANWEYLISNATGVDSAKLPPVKVITTASGVTVGFVGAVTDELPTLVSPVGIAGIVVSDPVAAVDAYAGQLKDGDTANGEADLVVALIHEDYNIAAKVGANVDAVIAGHTHLDTQTTTASGAPVLEPSHYGKVLGEVSLNYDRANDKVVNATAANKSMEGVATDPEIAALYDAAKAQADELGKVPVANVSGNAYRGTNSGSDTGANRGTESSLGNLLAQSFLEYSSTMAIKADFGIMNPGGIRADFDQNTPDGVITVQEALSIQPFGNEFTTIEITAAQVYTMLEQQWNPDPAASRPVLRLGLSDNVHYVYDPAAPVGSKVLTVTIDGKTLDRADTTTKYTVASNHFLLEGGDGFKVFAEPAAAQTLNKTGIIEVDAFNYFIKKHEPLTPDFSQRSFGFTGGTDFTAEQEYSVDLASLTMTVDAESKPATVAAKLVDSAGASFDLGTFDIDPTVTPTLDDTGKATVTFTVPAEVAGGAGELVFTTDDGATFSVAVNLTAVPQPEPQPEPEPTVTPKATLNKLVTVAGGEVVVAGSDFKPGENLRLELHSTPVVLTNVTADATGAFSTTVTIPAGTALGDHSVVIVREAATDAPLSLALKVVAAETPNTDPAPTPTPAPAPAPTPELKPTLPTEKPATPELAKTGAGVETALLLTLSMLAAGGASLALRKRNS